MSLNYRNKHYVFRKEHVHYPNLQNKTLIASVSVKYFALKGSTKYKFLYTRHLSTQYKRNKISDRNLFV